MPEANALPSGWQLDENIQGLNMRTSTGAQHPCFLYETQWGLTDSNQTANSQHAAWLYAFGIQL